MAADARSRVRVLTTARLDLHAATLVHLDAELEGPQALAAVLDAAVPASWPAGEYDADAIRFFRQRLIEDGEHAVGWYGWYAVRRAEGSPAATLVGSAGFMGPPAADGTVEVGYSVAPEHRRLGYATEMIEALLSRAFADPHTSRVIAHTTDDNVASVAALRRAGFLRAGPGREPGQVRFERGR